MVGPPALVVGK